MARVLLVGGLNVDTLARTSAPPVAGTSNPGTTTRAAGGVARNVADNLRRLGDECTFVGAVGVGDVRQRRVGEPESADAGDHLQPGRMELPVVRVRPGEPDGGDDGDEHGGHPEHDDDGGDVPV